MKRKFSHDSTKWHTNFSRIPSSSHDRHYVFFHGDMFHWYSLFEIFMFCGVDRMQKMMEEKRFNEVKKIEKRERKLPLRDEEEFFLGKRM